MKTKLAFLWFYDCYNAVMDHNKNPLRNIPDPVSRMWIMTVLAWMWSVVFGAYLGSVIYGRQPRVPLYPDIYGGLYCLGFLRCRETPR